MSYLVGFIGELWSGGAFESEAASPKEAALEVFESHGSSFIEGKDNIKNIIVTNFGQMTGWRFKLVNDDWVEESSNKL